MTVGVSVLSVNASRTMNVFFFFLHVLENTSPVESGRWSPRGWGVNRGLNLMRCVFFSLLLRLYGSSGVWKEMLSHGSTMVPLKVIWLDFFFFFLQNQEKKKHNFIVALKLRKDITMKVKNDCRRRNEWVIDYVMPFKKKSFTFDSPCSSNRRRVIKKAATHLKEVEPLNGTTRKKKKKKCLTRLLLKTWA